MDDSTFSIGLISNLQQNQYMTIWQDLNILIDNMVRLGMDREEAKKEVFEVLQDL